MARPVSRWVMMTASSLLRLRSAWLSATNFVAEMGRGSVAASRVAHGLNRSYGGWTPPARRWPWHCRFNSPELAKPMPTPVTSIFPATISDFLTLNARTTASPRQPSSAAPRDPNRCDVRQGLGEVTVCCARDSDAL